MRGGERPPAGRGKQKDPARQPERAAAPGGRGMDTKGGGKGGAAGVGGRGGGSAAGGGAGARGGGAPGEPERRDVGDELGSIITGAEEGGSGGDSPGPLGGGGEGGQEEAARDMQERWESVNWLLDEVELMKAHSGRLERELAAARGESEALRLAGADEEGMEEEVKALCAKLNAEREERLRAMQLVREFALRAQDDDSSWSGVPIPPTPPAPS